MVFTTRQRGGRNGFECELVILNITQRRPRRTVGFRNSTYVPGNG